MTTTSVRARSRRTAAAVSSGALALWALAAVPPAAEAVSSTISYTCTSVELGTFTLSVVLDTTAPARMTTGQTTQVAVTTRATLPADRAQYATTTYGANAVEASLTPQAIFGTVTTTPTQNVPRVPLNGADVSLVGSSAPFTYTAPTTSGSLDVTAGGITGELKFLKDAVEVKKVVLTCTAPNGKAPVIDTIAVASSTTTTLTVSRSTAAYGQNVTASSKVVASSGSPAGDVAFAVDGIVTRAKVDKDGVASVVLPDAVVGAHQVLATFMPSDVAAFVGSTSVTKVLAVEKAEAKARIPVTGKTTKVATHVGVKVRGVFDTVPTGNVRITVKRLGKPGKWVKSRTLSGAGTARLRLRLLAAGRYRVVVLYRGDANHLVAKKTKTFRVKPG